MQRPTDDNSRAADALTARQLTQEGRTEDKVPGYDPAAAPMETDQEAGSGGNPSAPIDARSEPARPAATSSADAMRRLNTGDAGRSPGRTAAIWMGAGVVVLVLVGLVAVLS